MEPSRHVQYQVLHNLDARFSRGYEPGDRLVEGHRGTVTLGPPGALAACEAVFALHNRDDRPDGRDAPSLSVGDVVVLGEVAFTCATLGFTPVTLTAADVVPGPWREVVARLRD